MKTSFIEFIFAEFTSNSPEPFGFNRIQYNSVISLAGEKYMYKYINLKNMVTLKNKVHLTYKLINCAFELLKLVILLTLCITSGRFCSSTISNQESHATNGNINITGKNLKLAALNIRGGLKEKKAEIEFLLEKYKFDIFGLSETNQSCRDQIDYSDSMYNFIPGFTYSKETTRVGLLVKKGLNFKLRADIMKKLQLPAVWIEFRSKGKLITVINVYREHRQVGLNVDNNHTKTGAAQLERWSHFVHYWERSLTTSDETWLLGDVNIDPTSLYSSDPQYYYRKKMCRLIDERILSKGVIQLVKGNTWTSSDGKASSLIDHIYTDSLNYTSVSNFRCSGSDHNLISVVRKGEVKLIRNQFRRSRNMSKFCKVTYLWLLNQTNLDPILTEPNPETQVQLLTAAMEAAADICCPYVNFTIKKNHTKWMTSDLKDLISCRDSWYKEFVRTGDAGDHAHYRSYRNKVNVELKKAKKAYYVKTSNAAIDPKDVWSKLNEASGRNTTFEEPITLVKDGLTIDDPQSIAETFNLFYQEKVRKILSELPTAPEPEVKPPPSGTVFNFHKIRVKEVRKHIFSLTGSKATGHDGLSNVLLKAGNIVIAPVVTRIINNCIRLSVFPETWKVGKISVIYKNKGPRTEPNSYRPITLLCSLSKLIEKVMFKQILNYFTNNNMMDPRQYGFRPHRSCSQAVVDYLTMVHMCKEDPESPKVNTILIDLSAAFDIVGHSVLLRKLKKYGFSEDALKLIESYLSDRTVYTEIENKTSSLLPDLYGVPQGSILGPLLYVIYVICLKDHDDVPKIVYADDTTAIVAAKTREELDTATNEAMSSLIKFFAGSGLKLNNNKTELITHCGGEAKVIVNEHGDTQDSVKSARLLGIIIDSNLNFHDHIDLLIKDVEYRMWLFKRISKVAGLRNRLIYAHGLLFSKFIFGIESYAGSDKTYLEKVRVCYDKCIRLTFGYNPDNLTTEEMRAELRILSFENLVKLMDLTMFRDIIKTGKPEKLAGLLQTTYNRNSRLADAGYVRVKVIPKKEKFRRSFIFRASQLWNNLPSEFKEKSKNQFHDSVKSFLLGDFNGPGPAGPLTNLHFPPHPIPFS